MIFGRKRASPRPKSSPRKQRRRRSKKEPEPASPPKKGSPSKARKSRLTMGGPQFFEVRTRLAKSAGTVTRHKLNAIRVLPTKKKDTVILQATDGTQAVCVMTRGMMSSPRLVPSEVLPIRKCDDVMVALAVDQWRSSDGKSIEDKYKGETNFPPMVDVLPDFNTQSESSHLRLGIDLALLDKVSMSLGTSKLTLFIPIPRKATGGATGESYVNKPIAVCPATDEEGVRGIGVVMPLQPRNGKEYFMKVRKLVSDSEARLWPKAGTRTLKPV